MTLGRLERDRLAWKCRRGLLELDLVLERYLRLNAAGLDAAQLALLHELLEYEDNELWAVVSGRSEAYDPRHASLVAGLRTV